jgi:hypothetical protein
MTIKMQNIVIYEDEKREIPVMTTTQVAEAFGVSEEVIRKNYSNNKKRFVERKHFYSKVKNLHNLDISSPRGIMVWTEKGVARLSKSIGTETAWDIFEQLEETYFIVKEGKLNLPSYQIEDRVARAKQWIIEEEERQELEGQVIQLEKTKAQISRKREATAMGRLSQLTQKINKLTDYEKRDGEYTATEIAIKVGIYSENGNPHSQMVGAFLNNLPDKKNYFRKVKVLLDNGKGTDCKYYNKLFLEKFINFINKEEKNFLNLNGRNFKFSKL